MTIQGTNTSIEQLVALLCGPAQYCVDDLRRGLEHEWSRLGSRPYLLVQAQIEYDMGGRTDCLTFLESYNTLESAIAAANDEADALIERHAEACQPPASSDRTAWRHIQWPKPGAELLRKPMSPLGASGLYCREIAFKGGYLETMYYNLYVLGPFAEEIVGPELVQLFAEDKFELKSHMVRVGEALRTKASEMPGLICGRKPERE